MDFIAGFFRKIDFAGRRSRTKGSLFNITSLLHIRWYRLLLSIIWGAIMLYNTLVRDKPERNVFIGVWVVLLTMLSAIAILKLYYRRNTSGSAS